jgi:outer membrane protein assembly factor BamB
MVAMGDPGCAAGSDGPGCPVDPDAMWRPSSLLVRVADDGVANLHRCDPIRPRRLGVSPAVGPIRLGSDARSPWSRDAVEAPLPTIGEIRLRARRELASGGEPDSRTEPTKVPVTVGLAEFAGVAEVGEPTVTATWPQDPVRANVPHRSSTSDDIDEAPRSDSTGNVVLTGILTAIAVVAAAVAAWAVTPESGAAPVGPRLPAEAEPRWVLDPVADRTAPVAWGRTAVARIDAAELLVYELSDGTLRWRAPLAGADPAVAFFDEAVVAVTTTGRSDVAVMGFDPTDGAVLWRRSDHQAVAVAGPGAPVLLDGRRDAVVMRVLDPATGEEVGDAAEAVTMSTATPYVVSRVGELLAVIDLRSGTRVGPAVPAFGLRSIAPVGGHIVGLTDDNDIVLFDEYGDVADQRPFISLAFGDFTGRAELVGEVPGTTIGIVSSGTSVGFDVGSGEIETLWEIDGRVHPPVETAVGPVAVARVVSPTTGEVDHAIVDPRDGSTIAVTDSGMTREGAPVIRADGYVVTAAVGDRGRTITAYSFDGDERWNVSLPPAASFEVAPGTLLVLEASGSIAAYR